VGVTPTTILDAPTKNPRNTKDKHANQPAEKRLTPCGIHVLPLSNRLGAVFAHYVIKVLILWFGQRRFYAYALYINVVYVYG